MPSPISPQELSEMGHGGGCELPRKETTRLKMHANIQARVRGSTYVLRCLVDTGNSVRGDCVLNLETAQRMGLQIRPLPGRTVGTAKKSSSLRLIGVTEGFKIRLKPQAEIYDVTAIVVESLSQEMNLGAYFLLKHELDLRFRKKEGVTLRNKEGERLTELVQQLDMASTSSPKPPGEYGVDFCNAKVDDFVEKMYQQIEKEPEKIEVFEPAKISVDAKVENLIFPNAKVENLNDSKAKVEKLFNLDATNDSCLEGESDQRELGKQKEGGEVTVLQEGKSVYLKLVRPTKVPNHSVNVIRFDLPPLEDEKVLISCLNSGNAEVPGQEVTTLVPGLYRVQEEAGKKFVEVLMTTNLEDSDQLAQAQDRRTGEKVEQLFVKLPQEVALGVATRVEEAKFSVVEKICEVESNQGTEDKDGKGGGNVELEFEQLLRDLKVHENEMLKSNKKAKTRLVRMLRRYQSCFNINDGPNRYGSTKMMEMEIRIKPGHLPVKQKVRPLNPTQEQVLKNQIEEWKAHGIIEKSRSEWASPTVIVAKKNSSVPWRVCIDYRRLNAATEGDSYPLPRVEDLISKAGGHKIYSALDASNAYMAIPLAPQSRPLTAFTSPLGLWQFNRMPFGLKGAGACYSRFIDSALSELGQKNLNVYLDDVLIYHQDLNRHLDKLEEVLEVHQRAGIRINARKTNLLVSECNYLGHRLTPEGIQMIPEYVERVVNWPEPTNIKQLNCLLGFMTYYRHYIPSFSSLTAPMMEQKRKKKLEWTEEMSTNLKLLKEKFLSAPVRGVPDFKSKEKFILTCDYSGKAISAILSQVQNGAERLISVGGRKCTEPESRYASWRGEMSAIIHGMRKYDSILRFKPFIVVTDSACMKHLQTMERPKGLAGRWLDELQSYSFDVVHRPGRLNRNADNLSRSDHLPDPTPEDVKEHQEYVNALTRTEVKVAQA